MYKIEREGESIVISLGSGSTSFLDLEVKEMTKPRHEELEQVIVNYGPKPSRISVGSLRKSSSI